MKVKVPQSIIDEGYIINASYTTTGKLYAKLTLDGTTRTYWWEPNYNNWYTNSKYTSGSVVWARDGSHSIILYALSASFLKKALNIKLVPE